MKLVLALALTSIPLNLGELTTVIIGRDTPLYSQTEPSSPFNGYRWRETTGGDTDPLYAWEWEWNGTYWLSSTEYSETIKDIAAGGRNQDFELPILNENGLNLAVTTQQWSGRSTDDPPTNDASNYWEFGLYSIRSNNARALTVSLSSQGVTFTGDRYHMYSNTLVHVDMLTAAQGGNPVFGFELYALSTGSPSSFTGPAAYMITYRWARR